MVEAEVAAELPRRPFLPPLVLDVRLQASGTGDEQQHVEASLLEVPGAQLVTYDRHLISAHGRPSHAPKAVYVQYQTVDPVTGALTSVVHPVEISPEVFADPTLFGQQEERPEPCEEEPEEPKRAPPPPPRPPPTGFRSPETRITTLTMDSLPEDGGSPIGSALNGTALFSVGARSRPHGRDRTQTRSALREDAGSELPRLRGLKKKKSIDQNSSSVFTDCESVSETPDASRKSSIMNASPRFLDHQLMPSVVLASPKRTPRRCLVPRAKPAPWDVRSFLDREAEFGRPHDSMPEWATLGKNSTSPRPTRATACYSARRSRIAKS